MFTLNIRSGHKVTDRNLATLELLADALSASGCNTWKIWRGSQELRRA